MAIKAAQNMFCQLLLTIKFENSLNSRAIMLPITLALGASIALFVLYLVLSIGQRPKNYPPGPPTIPILGNIHQVRQLISCEMGF